MATVALTTTPATLDGGGSEFVTVTNTGAVDVTVSRGSQSFTLRPNQSRTVYPEGAAVTATASGTGQVTTLAQAAQVTQAQQVAANTAAIAGLPGTYVRKSTAAIDLNLAPYNAAPGQDIASALQAAYDYVAANYANGGDIYFSTPGTYLVNGASQTGTAQGYSYAGQVLIPAVAEATSRPIRLRGLFPTSGGGQSTGAPNGVILLSNATSGYVFDIKPAFTQFGCPWTGVMPIFEDIVIRNAADNPTAGGINLLCTQRAQIRRVQVDTPTSFIAPTSGSLAALVMPQVYNNGDVTVRDTTIRGYPIGVLASEHGVFDNVDIAYCLTAFKGNGRSHSNWFGYVDIEECPTMFAGGSAPAFGTPSVPAGMVIHGHVDYENKQTSGSLAPVAFVNDASTNPVQGLIHAWGTVSGTFPVVGGRSLDVVPMNLPPSLGARVRAPWTATHPYDNFAREIALSGTGAPGQCSPSLHPWRVDSGSFSVSGGQLKGLTASNVALVPSLKAASYGGVSRTVTVTTTLGATSPRVEVIASAMVNTSGVSQNGAATAIVVRLDSGVQAGLRINNNLVAVGGSNMVAGNTYTVQLAVYHDAKGYPYAVKVYLNGSLIISSGIPAAYISLGGTNPSTWPYYEDGVAIKDTGSAVTLFSVQDTTVDPPFVASNTATLVAGTVTVANTAITASSRIRVFNTSAGGTVGALSVSLSAGTGFTITSSSGTDTSVIYYEIVSY